MPGSGKIAVLRGRWAEEVALKYLLNRNLKLIEKNFRSKFGEIDLIMKDTDIVCFIEVRYRTDDHFHQAAESINKRKQERIILTSQQYLTNNYDTDDILCRFDTVTLSGKQEKPIIEWLKDAFQV